MTTDWLTVMKPAHLNHYIIIRMTMFDVWFTIVADVLSNGFQMLLIIFAFISAERSKFQQNLKSEPVSSKPPEQLPMETGSFSIDLDSEQLIN